MLSSGVAGWVEMVKNSRKVLSERFYERYREKKRQKGKGLQTGVQGY